MIKKITNFMSYTIIPAITLENKAPNVAPWNTSFLNWFYLKKAMKKASNYYIQGLCIDIGSGNSPYRKYLKHVTSYISLDKKETNASTHKENINMVEGDAKELPFESNYADSIILNQVLEHIYEHNIVLKEIHRVLKNEGKLIISVPIIYHIHAEPNDYFRFTEYGIRRLLKENGFKILELKYNGYFGTAIVSIINSFVWQIWNNNLYLKLLRNTLFIPFILIFFFFNNIMGLILDTFKLKKFSPNYFIICEKIDE